MAYMAAIVFGIVTDRTFEPATGAWERRVDTGLLAILSALMLALGIAIARRREHWALPRAQIPRAAIWAIFGFAALKLAFDLRRWLEGTAG